MLSLLGKATLGAFIFFFNRLTIFDLTKRVGHSRMMLRIASGFLRSLARTCKTVTKLNWNQKLKHSLSFSVCRMHESKAFSEYNFSYQVLRSLSSQTGKKIASASSGFSLHCGLLLPPDVCLDPSSEHVEIFQQIGHLPRYSSTKGNSSEYCIHNI